MNIIDNFLPYNEFENIKDIVLKDSTFPFYYNNETMYAPDDESIKLNNRFGIPENSPPPFFTHIFYKGFEVRSPYYHSIVVPILKLLAPRALLRAQMNISITSSEGSFVGWHVDEGTSSEYTSAVFYLTDNPHSYTILETGEKIDTISNRLVSFDGRTLHNAVWSEGVRALININYIK
jgi:hypothetical protein